jgi:RecA-family ATPase
MVNSSNSQFNFDVEIPDTTWLVDGLIPMGHMCFLLAKAGVGKSLILECLGIHVIHARPFADKRTIEGDVLIIDQDSPTNVLSKRLIKFNAAMGDKPKHTLFVKSMKDYKLSDSTLTTVINDYPSAVLVLIDSLHSVCGKLNPNYTSDMNTLAVMKSKVMSKNRTIIFTHHISQHEDSTLDTLMTGDTGHLAMGNSAIIQQADSYYIIGATANNGMTDRLYMRPVAKRESIPSKPVILRLIQVDNGEKMIYDGMYTEDMDSVQKDVITLFREQGTERTVKEIYEAMGHRHGETAVRKALASLDDAGKILMSKGQSNLFKYRLP